MGNYGKPLKHMVSDDFPNQWNLISFPSHFHFFYFCRATEMNYFQKSTFPSFRTSGKSIFSGSAHFPCWYRKYNLRNCSQFYFTRAIPFINFPFPLLLFHFRAWWLQNHFSMFAFPSPSHLLKGCSLVQNPPPPPSKGTGSAQSAKSLVCPLGITTDLFARHSLLKRGTPQESKGNMLNRCPNPCQLSRSSGFLWTIAKRQPGLVEIR